MSIHVVYTGLTDKQREAVDLAWEAAANSLKDCGYAVSMTDPAERLVEAIAVYLVESRKP